MTARDMAGHHTNHERRGSRLFRSLAVLVAAAVTSVALIGGCSDDEPTPTPQGGPSASGTPATEVPQIPTRSTVGRVTGKLGGTQKERVKLAVTKVMDEFFDRAYLGAFPRESYDKAYAAFTDGARKDAERDAGLLSNARIADRIDRATATKRRVAIDVLAVKGRGQGVKAWFTLKFDTAGDLESTQRVKGYLLMNDEGEGWQVFGYDVVRSVIT